MPDRQAANSLVESCNSRISSVFCPHRKELASITVARWQTREGRSTPWVVIDCPFLLAGTVSCDMSCLSQLDGNPA